jgi:hypothetical protein
MFADIANDKLRNLGNEMQAIPLATISKMISSGELNNLGYTDPKATLGLTPDQFSSYMKTTPSPMQNLNAAQQLADSIRGTSELRKMMAANIAQGIHGDTQEAIQDKSQTFQAHEKELDRNQQHIENELQGLRQIDIADKNRLAELERANMQIRAQASEGGANRANAVKIAEMQQELKQSIFGLKGEEAARLQHQKDADRFTIEASKAKKSGDKTLLNFKSALYQAQLAPQFGAVLNPPTNWYGGSVDSSIAKEYPQLNKFFKDYTNGAELRLDTNGDVIGRYKDVKTGQWMDYPTPLIKNPLKDPAHTRKFGYSSTTPLYSGE